MNLDIEFPTEPSLFKVKYEDTNTSNERISILPIYKTIYSKDDLIKTIKNMIVGFDSFKTDAPISIKEKIYKKIERKVAIISLEEEFEINNLINEGYAVHKYLEDKCILHYESYDDYRNKEFRI